MCNEGIIEEELDISNADDFGVAVPLLGHFDVLAQSHCKEERNERQLCNC